MAIHQRLIVALPARRPDHFLCTHGIFPLDRYTAHMAEAHDGRTDCVQQFAASDVAIMGTSKAVQAVLELERRRTAEADASFAEGRQRGYAEGLDDSLEGRVA